MLLGVTVMVSTEVRGEQSVVWDTRENKGGVKKGRSPENETILFSLHSWPLWCKETLPLYSAG